MDEQIKNDLIERKNLVDTRLAKVKRGISEIKVNAYQNGKFAEPGFYRAQTQKLEQLKTESQKIQAELGRLKEKKTWTTPVLLESFVNAARERLPKDEFDAIMKRAKRVASMRPNT